MLRAFFSDEAGATAMEYGVIASVISVATLGGVFAMSNALRATFIAWSSSM